MQVNSTPFHILIVDDEQNIRKSLQLILEAEGYKASIAPDAIKAFEFLNQEKVHLIILDINMPQISGLEMFERMQKEGITTPVIVISGNATLTEAARAIQMGAFDFIEKPFTAERVSLTVKRCLEFFGVKEELKNIRSESVGQKFIGQSPQIKKTLAMVEKIAPTEATVLITGESGTGKELIAQMIHDRSKRKNRPYIKVNCSAIPENLIESELFGHEKGAFTGAIANHRGFFEQANGGTIFLDEIGDMPLSAQAKLLRVLQSSEIQKLGSEKLQKIDVRVVAATHRNLESEIAAKKFREDLYFRLNVVPIVTLPLRDHKEDLPELVMRFVQDCCLKNGIKEKAINPEVIALLKEHSWPGNVRELHNFVERMVILSGNIITKHDVPAGLFKNTSDETIVLGKSLKDFKEESEKKYLIAVLKSCEGNISKTAKILGIERTHLHKKIQVFEITKKDYFG